MEAIKTHLNKNKAVYKAVGVIAFAILVWISAQAIIGAITEKGVVEVRNIPMGGILLVDGVQREKVDEGIATVRIDVSIGKHTITVTREDTWPWAKTLDIKDKDNVILNPFIIFKNSNLEVLSPESKEYKIADALFNKKMSNRITSSDGLVKVFVEESELLAEFNNDNLSTAPQAFCPTGYESCDKDILVSNIQDISDTEIAFLGNRNDVVIIKNSGAISAIELDKRGAQNFQPLYTRGNGEFRSRDNNTIYIKDKGKFFILTFN